MVKLVPLLSALLFLGCSSAPADEPELAEPEASVDAGPGTSAGEGDDPGTVGDGPRLRIMSYNIKRGQLSGTGEIAATINAFRPDLVGLQEVANGIETNSNQTYYLAQKTGMGPALRNAKAVGDGYQANALLSGYPILNNEKFILTSSDEVRILLLLTVQISPELVATVGVTHFGLVGSERPTAAQEVVDIMKDRPNPLLIGDFNDRPDAESIRVLEQLFRDAWPLAGDGPGATFPAGEPENRIDYVFLGEGWPDPSLALVGESDASDHLPLIVDVPLP